MENVIYFLLGTLVITILVLLSFFIIGSIVYFGYKLLDINIILGIVVMMPPLILIIVSFEVGEYF